MHSHRLRMKESPPLQTARDKAADTVELSRSSIGVRIYKGKPSRRSMRLRIHSSSINSHHHFHTLKDKPEQPQHNGLFAFLLVLAPKSVDNY